MSESIRAHIKRRVWWCMAVGIGGWLMIPLAAALGKSLPDAIPQGVFPVLGMLCFGGAMLALHRWVRCPKCKARLGQTIAMPLAFSWGSGPKVCFCPYCGVSLDSQLPHAAAVAPSQNPIHPA